jgi:hypothetical protein
MENTLRILLDVLCCNSEAMSMTVMGGGGVFSHTAADGHCVPQRALGSVFISTTIM